MKSSFWANSCLTLVTAPRVFSPQFDQALSTTYADVGQIWNYSWILVVAEAPVLMLCDSCMQRRHRLKNRRGGKLQFSDVLCKCPTEFRHRGDYELFYYAFKFLQGERFSAPNFAFLYKNFWTMRRFSNKFFSMVAITSCWVPGHNAFGCMMCDRWWWRVKLYLWSGSWQSTVQTSTDQSAVHALSVTSHWMLVTIMSCISVNTPLDSPAAGQVFSSILFLSMSVCYCCFLLSVPAVVALVQYVFWPDCKASMSCFYHGMQVRPAIICLNPFYEGRMFLWYSV